MRNDILFKSNFFNIINYSSVQFNNPDYIV